MTTNSVVVTVEGVEKIKITMEGMERWRRSSVHRGGRGGTGEVSSLHRGARGAVGGVPHYTVEGVELLEASFTAPWMAWRRRALRKR
jgi:hypothetical protein